MHVIDRTETFTLVGADARRGKITLFDAEGPRAAGPLRHVALRVPSLEQALANVTDPVLKTELDAQMQLPEGLQIVLVEGTTEVAVDLDHVAIATEDPTAAAEAWAALGFNRVPAGPAGGERLE